jgi:16S rRNA (guanine527-N7)-methyltransferase
MILARKTAQKRETDTNENHGGKRPMTLFYNQPSMDLARIAELLQPFLVAPASGGGTCELSETQLHNISMYIDILLRWNARMNLTSVRGAENIVTRHFGESLFAARQLASGKAPCGPPSSPPAIGTPTRPTASAQQDTARSQSQRPRRLIDLGSGAGFPGVPIKLWSPQFHLTLIESNQKKAIFLREVIRRLALVQVEVFAGRAQQFRAHGDVVTLRAVERFEEALSTAAGLLSPGGKIALLIGERQQASAERSLPEFKWAEASRVPRSENRILLLGEKTLPQEEECPQERP